MLLFPAPPLLSALYMGRLACLFLCLSFVTAACGGSSSADGGVACTGSAPNPLCPGGSCPATWTTDAASWCRRPDAGLTYPIRYTRGCNGFDIVDYMGVDQASFVLYRAADGQLVGIQGVDANRMTHTCVANVPDTFDASQCRNQFQLIQCGP